MTDLRVVAGRPSSRDIAVVAAVAVLLDTARAAAAAPAEPAWALAARREGLGEAPFASAADSRFDVIR